MHLETRTACASIRKALPFTVRSFVQYGFMLSQKTPAIYAQ